MEGRIIFATGNIGKVREIQMILEDLGLPVVTMKQAGIDVEIVEDGKSFEENARIKARTVAAAAREAASGKSPQDCQEAAASGEQSVGFHDIVMADDSGLEIDYLNGEPGIYSARYLGEDTPYSVKNRNLMDRLEGVPEEERSARFVCAIAAVLPDGTELLTRGTIEGRIGHEEKGSHGFGYDPIFFLPEYGKTTAELTEEEKNRISHRGKALQLMKEELKKHADFGGE